MITYRFTGLGAVENQFESATRRWHDPSVARYAIDGIALAILLATLWTRNDWKHPAVRPKDSFAWLLFLLALAFVLLIVNQALRDNRALTGLGSQIISSVITGVRGVVRVLLLLVFCYIIPHVFDGTLGSPTVTKIAKGAITAFYLAVVALWFAALVLTYVATYADLDVAGHARTISKAYYALYFATAILVSGFLALTILLRWINRTIRARIWLVFTILMFWTYNVANMVGVFGFSVIGRYRSGAGIVAFTFFDAIPLSLTMLGILMSVDASPRDHLSTEPEQL
ncbi:hypothetical protein B0O99DRAFT_281925 [Bisporella sp. PMI_857]|nr:hypothetical protein B0O99DRAFT_281925 [Bisporella sp. PMI_857]